MVAGAREQLAGVREKAVAEVTMRELEMQARTALMPLRLMEGLAKVEGVVAEVTMRELEVQKRTALMPHRFISF